MEKLICDNPSCNKSFLRYSNDISKRNYCSRSCAVSVNNHLFPKRKSVLRSCMVCGKRISQTQKFCSLFCRTQLQKKHSRIELLVVIKNIGQRLGRAPSRRELGNLSYECIREFGSWNKAVVEAKFQPHRSASQKMYRRIRAMAVDGHKCDSISEAIIDNWLTENKIAHEKDVFYPGRNYRADWSVKDTFIEYFGLAKDSLRYDKSIKDKIKFCLKKEIKLIEIYPWDIYPENKLNNKLKELIRY